MNASDSVYPWVQSEELRAEGISTRDWLAGQALAGLAQGVSPSLVLNGRTSAHDVAKAAYSLADAMLAESRMRGR